MGQCKVLANSPLAQFPFLCLPFLYLPFSVLPFSVPSFFPSRRSQPMPQRPLPERDAKSSQQTQETTHVNVPSLDVDRTLNILSRSSPRSQKSNDNLVVHHKLISSPMTNPDPSQISRSITNTQSLHPAQRRCPPLPFPPPLSTMLLRLIVPSRRPTPDRPALRILVSLQPR